MKNSGLFLAFALFLSLIFSGCEEDLFVPALNSNTKDSSFVIIPGDTVEFMELNSNINANVGFEPLPVEKADSFISKIPVIGYLPGWIITKRELRYADYAPWIEYIFAPGEFLSTWRYVFYPGNFYGLGETGRCEIFDKNTGSSLGDGPWLLYDNETRLSLCVCPDPDDPFVYNEIRSFSEDKMIWVIKESFYDTIPNNADYVWARYTLEHPTLK